MNRLALVISVALAIQLAGRTAHAESAQIPVNNIAVTVLGRQSAVISTSLVRLSDIAEVSSSSINDDEAVVALKKITIDPSPAPGKRNTIAARHVLDRLQAEGVDVNQIRYLLPRSIDVERAGRPVSRTEIERAIKSALEQSKLDAEIRQINFDNQIMIAPGDATFEAQSFQTADANRMGFSITAKVEGEESIKFTVDANVVQWQQVPVAKRPIDRGIVIGSEDLGMARLNIGQLPRDVTHDDKQIIGFEASRPIRIGETFTKAKLIVPPIISAGERVTISYKTGLLEATATGTALDTVGEGESIKVKNEASNKIITGIALEAGLVGVKP